MTLKSRAERTLIIAIVAIFTLLGFVYALTTPPFEASDELWHYPMIRHLADGNPLPVQVFDPALAGPWNQEASQPPLYYYIGAALTFWIDQSDMDQVRWLNPHVDNGVITKDGNINLAIHDPAANRWQGALLAVRLVRLFSVLLGALTVFLTYRIAGEVAPGRPGISLGAAGLNAFLPMFLFISGAVNNDNLAVPLASLALLLIIRVVTKRVKSYYPVHWWEWVLIGLIIGLAVLTKEGTLGLIPMALGAIIVTAWQRFFADKGDARGISVNAHASNFTARAGLSSGRVWPVVGGATLAVALVIFPVLTIAGWWYYRNVVLYGDWLGWNAFIAVLGQRARPASLAQLWGERNGFMMSYWGLFGGVNVPMADIIYTILNTVLVLSIIGFAFYFSFLLVKEWRLLRASPQTWPERLLRSIERNFGLIVILVFTAAVVYGLIQWATTTWSSQGRLVFTAISALSILMALGLAGLADMVVIGVNKLTGKVVEPKKARLVAVATPVLFLFGIAAAAPFLWIQPAYRPPIQSDLLQNLLDVEFDGQMRLTGYDIDAEELQPGDGVLVRLAWESLATMDRDWSVFVHLNDPVLERPIAQRDMYPGQGLLPTRLIEPGRKIISSYYLTIPQTAVSPAELDLVVGLYDYNTGERLPIARMEKIDSALIDQIPLVGREGPVPNPTAITFENGLKLVGFEIQPRRLMAGESLEVVTHWQPSRILPADYTFFAQIVAEDTTRFAAADLEPGVPTSQWLQNEIYEVRFPLQVDMNTPADVYSLIIGLYTRTADGDFDRLQLITPDGRLTDDFLELTRVRVDAP